MDWEIRRKQANQPANPNILNNGRINTRRYDSSGVLFGLGQFVLEHEGIKRDVCFYAAGVQEFRQLRQIRFGEVLGAHARIKLLKTKVDGVGAVLYRSARAVPISRWREQLGAGARGTTRAGFNRVKRRSTGVAGWTAIHQAC